MSSEKDDRDSGGLEVIADQADDGSFEFRVERNAHRSGGVSVPAGEGTESTSAERDTPAGGTTWRADEEVVEAGPSGSKRSLAIGAAAFACLLAVILGAVAVTGLTNDREPATVEVAEPAFEGVFVETPPLVIEEMAIIEQAEDAGTDTSGRSAAPAVVEEDERSLAPMVRGTRDPREPVIDDIVRTALREASREEEARRDREDEDSPEERDELAPEDEANLDDEYYYEDEYYDDEGYIDEEEPGDEYYDEEGYIEDEELLDEEEGINEVY